MQRRNGSSGRRVLILGCNGGVSTALLNLLARHPVGRELCEGIETLYLMDSEPATGEAPVPWSELPDTVRLPPLYIDYGHQLAEVLDRHPVDLVIELADVDTLDCVYTSGAKGADYLCTGYESYKIWPELQERLGDVWCQTAMVMLPQNRPRLERGSFLIGSGMNPGIVNALVGRAIRRFAEICGVPATAEDLDLYAILFTEEDTTRDTDGVDGQILPMSWNPRHFLNEVLAPASKYMDHGEVRFKDHTPHNALYRARCGHHEVDGMLVSHEEVYTIGARFRDLEVGYIYRVLPAAHERLQRSPERTKHEWPTRKLYPPTTRGIEGVDRVGVLVCSRTFGELWMGFENRCDEALGFDTNATLLQVAAGVLSGWKQLGEVTGLHLVEELDGDRYLEIASAVLGPAYEVHAPEAPFRPLAERCVFRRS